MSRVRSANVASTPRELAILFDSLTLFPCQKHHGWPRSDITATRRRHSRSDLVSFRLVCFSFCTSKEFEMTLDPGQGKKFNDLKNPEHCQLIFQCLDVPTYQCSLLSFYFWFVCPRQQ